MLCFSLSPCGQHRLQSRSHRCVKEPFYWHGSVLCSQQPPWPVGWPEEEKPEFTHFQWKEHSPAETGQSLSLVDICCISIFQLFTNRKAPRSRVDLPSVCFVFSLLSISWKRSTRCCGLSPMRRWGSEKPRRRAASSCSSWRPTPASCRTNAACWSAASWAWRRSASACRRRLRRRGVSTARARRPSATWWVGDAKYLVQD